MCNLYASYGKLNALPGALLYLTEALYHLILLLISIVDV
jgi:hypothetical protein